MLAQYDINRDVGLGTLIWAETRTVNGRIELDPAVPEIMGKAKELSDDRIFIMILGDSDIKPIYDVLFSYGADTVYHIRNKDLCIYNPEAYAECLADLSDRLKPANILIAGTVCGREVAPLTAAMLQTGLTADCTELSMKDDRLIMTRPALGGNILATIVCDTFPQMATIRPGTFRTPEPIVGRKGTAINRPFTPKMLKNIVSEVTDDDSDDISDAKILISLGNGIKDRKMVDVAEDVASKLGGKVSCSRVLVEKGWLSARRQVGQSGRNVSPDVYFAFGISGSVQHLAGIHAKKIIAVNSDPNAPIHDIADESIIGDASEILRKMDEKLRSLGQ
jgi:electron transfer flavoprotein alpha subunit